MMKLISKLSFVIFSLIFLVSCSKDNTTNPQITGGMADYMPLTIGSWWKYDNYDVDDFGNKYNKEILTYIVSDIHVIDGKQAFDIAVKKENNDTIYDGMMFFAIEDGKFLQYYNHPEIIERYGWIVAANLKTEKWTLIDTTIIKDSAGIYFKSREIWTIKKGGQKDFVIKNKNVPGIEFVSEKTYYNSDYLSNDTINIDNSTWYGKGIGLIRSIGKLKWYNWDGRMNYEMNLIDYEIK